MVGVAETSAVLVPDVEPGPCPICAVLCSMSAILLLGLLLLGQTCRRRVCVCVCGRAPFLLPNFLLHSAPARARQL